MRILILLFALLISSNVYAGVYLEPYVGYTMGTFDGKMTDGDGDIAKLDYDTSGALYGGKAGYAISMVAFGVDYMAGKLKYEGKFITLDDKNDFKTSAIGAFVQVTLPVQLKFSATYFFKSTYEHKAVDVLELKHKGNGAKVGFGITAIPFLSINVDYIMHSFDKIEQPGLTDISFEANSYMVGISCPLDI